MNNVIILNILPQNWPKVNKVNKACTTSLPRDSSKQVDNQKTQKTGYHCRIKFSCNPIYRQCWIQCPSEPCGLQGRWREQSTPFCYRGRAVKNKGPAQSTPVCRRKGWAKEEEEDFWRELLHASYMSCSDGLRSWPVIAPWQSSIWSEPQWSFPLHRHEELAHELLELQVRWKGDSVEVGVDI